MKKPGLKSEGRAHVLLDLWLIQLILLLRPDLSSAAEADPDGFAWWLINAGRKEYRSLPESNEFKEYLGAIEGGTGLTRLQYLVYQNRPDVQKAHPISDGPGAYAQWFYQHGVREHDLWDLLNEDDLFLASADPQRRPRSAPPSASLPSERPFGVNLIGYAFGQLGIGEDLRMAAKALEAAGVPFTIINFAPGADTGQADRSVAHWVGDSGPYRYNIFCLSALEHGRFFAERGSEQMIARYSIGYWPWELERWPPEWQGIFRLVDEVWASSQHTLGAVKGAAGKVPCHLMPMAVDLGPVSRKGRPSFGLPGKACLFCFAFDLNSSIHRKNAAACLEAFARAFPTSADALGPHEVGLVLKCHRPRLKNPLWTLIKQRAAKDKRIHVMEETLPRNELLALYRSCDCFVSLHRAEGFGRNIAEALQLGLHVITTGYSGNTDFCRPPVADLVDFRLVPVEEAQYPFSRGAVWADPDVDAAANYMMRFASRRRSARKGDLLPASYTVQAVGAKYRRRLTEIGRELAAAARTVAFQS